MHLSIFLRKVEQVCFSALFSHFGHFPYIEGTWGETTGPSSPAVQFVANPIIYLIDGQRENSCLVIKAAKN
jgi:hypothetical protein